MADDWTQGREYVRRKFPKSISEEDSAGKWKIFEEAGTEKREIGSGEFETVAWLNAEERILKESTKPGGIVVPERLRQDDAVAGGRGLSSGDGAVQDARKSVGNGLPVLEERLKED